MLDKIIDFVLLISAALVFFCAGLPHGIGSSEMTNSLLMMILTVIIIRFVKE